MGLLVAGVGLVLFRDMSFSAGLVQRYVVLGIYREVFAAQCDGGDRHPVAFIGFLPDSRFLASRPARSGAFGLRAGFGLPFRIVPHLQLYMDTPRWEGAHETL